MFTGPDFRGRALFKVSFCFKPVLKILKLVFLQLQNLHSKKPS